MLVLARIHAALVLTIGPLLAVAMVAAAAPAAPARGAPAREGGAPAREGGAPAREGGAPAREGGAPAREGGAPASKRRVSTGAQDAPSPRRSRRAPAEVGAVTPPRLRTLPAPRPQPPPPGPRTARQRREAVLETVVTARLRVDDPIADAAVRKEVISRRALEERGARTVGEALADHPGVQVGSQYYYERGAPQGVQISGCDARRVLFLRDGRRAVGETDGIVDVGTLALGDVARVELIRGATSTLYGADALCGVVNVIPRAPPDRGLRLGLRAEYGRLNDHTLRLSLGGRARPTLGLQFSGGWRGRDGFDLDPETPGTDGDHRRAVDGRVRALWQPVQRLRINAVLAYRADRRQRTLAESFPLMPGSRLYAAPWLVQRWEAALSAQYVFNRTDSLTLRIYDQVYRSDARRFEIQGDQRRRRRTTHNYLDVSLVGRVKLGLYNRLTAGLEASHEYLDLRRRQDQVDDGGAPVHLRTREVAGRTVHVEELFVQDELTPWTWLTLVPGLRYTHHAGFGHHVTPKLSVLAEPHPRLRLRASYGHGYRPPTLKNRFLVFDHSELGVPLVIRGNPDLAAETAHDVRASVELRPYRRALLHVGGFNTEYRNLIEQSLPTWADDHFEITRVNVGRARIAGAWAGFRLPWLGHFRVDGSYHFVHARNLDTDEILQNRPQHQARLALHFHHRRWGTRVAVWATYQSEVRVGSPVCGDDDGRSPGYAQLNAYLEQRVWPGVRLYLRGRNLTNTHRQGSSLCDLRPQPGWLLFGGILFTGLYGNDA
jgi:outer membrane receptor for ferrienterochelin and colicins